MDSIYIDIEEAADIIRPNRKRGTTNHSYWLLRYQIDQKNITPIYPEMAIVCEDTGKIIQVTGKSHQPFFLREEVENYAEQKKANVKRGPQRIVIAMETETGQEIEFESVSKAAEVMGLPYHVVYTAIFNKKERYSESLKRSFTFIYK